MRNAGILFTQESQPHSPEIAQSQDSHGPAIRQLKKNSFPFPSIVEKNKKIDHFKEEFFQVGFQKIEILIKLP